MHLSNPLIVQSDLTILAEVDSPRHAEARDRLARFATLLKMPEHVHTYRLTPLSLWNACAAGIAVDDIVGTLSDFAKFPLPPSVEPQLRDSQDDAACCFTGGGSAGAGVVVLPCGAAATSCSGLSAVAKSRRSPFRAAPILPSTCRMPRSRSRFPGSSGRGRKKRSGSAACSSPMSYQLRPPASSTPEKTSVGMATSIFWGGQTRSQPFRLALAPALVSRHSAG